MRFINFKLISYTLISLLLSMNICFSAVQYSVNPSPVAKGQVMYIAVKNEADFDLIWLTMPNESVIKLSLDADGVWYGQIEMSKTDEISGHFQAKLFVQKKDGQLILESIPYHIVDRVPSLFQQETLSAIYKVSEEINTELSQVLDQFKRLIDFENDFLTQQFKLIKTETHLDQKETYISEFHHYLLSKQKANKQFLEDYSLLISSLEKQVFLLKLRNQQLYDEGIRIKLSDDEFQSLSKKEDELEKITSLYYRQLNYLDMTLETYETYLQRLKIERQWVNTEIQLFEEKLSSLTENDLKGFRFSDLKQSVDDKLNLTQDDLSNLVSAIQKDNKTRLSLYKKQLHLDVSVLNLKSFRDDIKI